MKMTPNTRFSRICAAAALALTIAACAGMTLEQAQKRAAVSIQAAQKESIAALNAGKITAAQDRAAQAKLTAMYGAVRSAASPAEVDAILDKGGVKP